MSVNSRLQILCVWAGPAFLVSYLIGFVLLAHFIPPPSPHWSAQHIAAFVDAHRFGIRLGMVLGLVSSTLLFPFFAVISTQIARIEGNRAPVLAIIQFGAGVLLLVFFAVCGMLWIVMSFRTGMDPATLRTLNDLAWLMFVMVFPGYVSQMLCIAVAGLMDRDPHPTWPRPAAYFNLWVAVSGTGGGIAVFFKHGPFAWNGLIGFYVPIAVFFIWLVLTTRLLLAAVRRQGTESPAGVPVGAPSLAPVCKAVTR